MTKLIGCRNGTIWKCQMTNVERNCTGGTRCGTWGNGLPLRGDRSSLAGAGLNPARPEASSPPLQTSIPILAPNQLGLAGPAQCRKAIPAAPLKSNVTKILN